MCSVNKKCLILSHLSLGDQLIINGLVRFFSIKYFNIFILCKDKHLKSLISIYSDNNSIIPISVDTNNYIIQNDHYLFSLFNDKDIDIIRLGAFNDNWNHLKSNYIVDNLPYSFYETFYNQINLDYNIRYKYEFINRNTYRENQFYNNTMSKYTINNYVFVHNLNNSPLFNHTFLYNKCIPIFHPNFNYYSSNPTTHKYHYDYWNGNISDNIMDYCKILENAYEIHVIFSSFFNLCMYLDLSKVVKKYIYTNVYNIKDLHVNLKDWNIIYF